MSQEDERALLMDRIQAGRSILLKEQEDLKRVASRCEEIIVFVGGEEAARKLSPTLFEEWQLRDKNVKEIARLLHDLTQKYNALGAET